MSNKNWLKKIETMIERSENIEVITDEQVDKINDKRIVKISPRGCDDDTSVLIAFTPNLGFVNECAYSDWWSLDLNGNINSFIIMFSDDEYRWAMSNIVNFLYKECEFVDVKMNNIYDNDVRYSASTLRGKVVNIKSNNKTATCVDCSADGHILTVKLDKDNNEYHYNINDVILAS